METKFKRKEHHDCIHGRKNGLIWGEYNSVTWCFSPLYLSTVSCPSDQGSYLYGRALLGVQVITMYKYLDLTKFLDLIPDNYFLPYRGDKYPP